MRRLNKIRAFLSFIYLISLLFLFACENKDRNEVGEKIFSSERTVILPYLTISPDGKWLAFATHSADNYPDPSRVNLINLIDNSLIVFPQKESILGPIGWSPDSSSIIFATTKFKGVKWENILKQITISKRKEEIISTPCEGTLFGPVISKSGQIIFLEFLSKKEIINKQKYYYCNLWHMDKNRKAKKIAEGLFGLDYKWDNNSIYFVRGKKEKEKIVWSLYLKEIQKDEEKLLRENISAFLFSNTDYFFYFKTIGEMGEIRKVSKIDLKDATIGHIKKSVYFPLISPDGTKIAFLRKNQVWTLDLLSLRENQLTRTRKPKQYLIWTKDGRYIIYNTDKDLIKIEAR